MKNSELQIVPNDYGIEEKKANELIGNLPQIKQERSVLEQQYEEVVKMDMEDPKSAKTARELRLKIRDNRTKGIEVWHKTTKEFFLKGGQFVDAIKRMEVAVNQRMEETLEQIEKYAEIQEAKRKEELKNKRVAELEIYSEFVPFGIDLGSLSEEEYSKVFNGAKLQCEAKLEEERKAEAERKRLEEIQKIHNERKEKLLPYWQFIENKNQNFGELSVSDFSQLHDFAKKDKENKEAEEERIRKENERLAKEKAELEAKAKKEREEAEKKLAEERKKQAELEAQLKAEKEAKERAERERLAEEERKKKEAEKMAKAPIKKQMTAWIDLFIAPEKTVKNELSDDILAKFESFKKWAKLEIEKL